MPVFRKRPVEIVACQFTGGPANGTELVLWVVGSGGAADWFAFEGALGCANGKGRPETPEHMLVHTLEGAMWADVGDWIIRGVKGEFYPCKPDIFEATYDEVPA